MDGWVMVAIYLGPAAILALCMNRSRFLRRRAGWGRFGAQSRPDSMEGAQLSVLASLGTGRAAETSGTWRVFKPSWGVRLVPIAAGAGISYYFLFDNILHGTDAAGLAVYDTPVEIYLVMMGFIALSVAYVFRTRVATNGHVLKVRGLTGERRYALDRLRDIEEDGVHSYRLTFLGGEVAEILKTVEGATELRHMLAQRLEQNLRG